MRLLTNTNDQMKQWEPAPSLPRRHFEAARRVLSRTRHLVELQARLRTLKHGLGSSRVSELDPNEETSSDDARREDQRLRRPDDLSRSSEDPNLNL